MILETGSLEDVTLEIIGAAMGTIRLRLPDSLHTSIRELASEHGISVNQFISTAAAEKLAAIMTVEYLEKRAQRGSREKFEAALARHPDAEFEDYDKL